MNELRVELKIFRLLTPCKKNKRRKIQKHILHSGSIAWNRTLTLSQMWLMRTTTLMNSFDRCLVKVIKMSNFRNYVPLHQKHLSFIRVFQDQPKVCSISITLQVNQTINSRQTVNPFHVMLLSSSSYTMLAMIDFTIRKIYLKRSPRIILPII